MEPIKYIYHVIQSISEMNMSGLIAMGAQGWELVSVVFATDYPNIGERRFIYYFKRKKIDNL